MAQLSPDPDCILCRPDEADAHFGRQEVWSDRLWRLTTSVGPNEPLAGFSYLERRRHIRYIHELDGEGAATFGPVIALVTSTLKEASGTELVYVYVFGGGIVHLHLHLAPHYEGDALNAQMIRGEVVKEKLPGGATAVGSKDFPAIPEPELKRVAESVKRVLGGRPQSNVSPPL